MRELPAAGRLAAWGSAALVGQVGLDDAAAAVRGAEDPAHQVVGLPHEDAAVTLAYGLGRLRSLGARRLRLVLPRPGDVSGLAGPAPVTRAALAAGSAVVADGADLVLVPMGRAAWRAWGAEPDPRTYPDLTEAQRTLAAAVRDAARDLAELDVAHWQPAAAEVLNGRSRVTASPLPPGSPPAAVQLLAQALRVASVAEVALAGTGAALAAGSMAARDAALQSLADAARHAIEAACTGPSG